MATVLAGLIATHFGPGPGGLFLAFPAIFPATATLIEAHEKKRKAKTGHDGTNRGRMAASIDAAGASLACIGLAGFAVTLRLMLRAQCLAKPDYGAIGLGNLIRCAVEGSQNSLASVSNLEMKALPLYQYR